MPAWLGVWFCLGVLRRARALAPAILYEIPQIGYSIGVSGIRVFPRILPPSSSHCPSLRYGTLLFKQPGHLRQPR